MNVKFYKYQGTGKDFIMIDNRSGVYNFIDTKEISFLCDRRFGVGADGLIKLNQKEGYNFEMDYYNSDGSKSFCGNGARCTVAFANFLGIDTTNSYFLGIDGAHVASYNNGYVTLDMSDVKSVSTFGQDYLVNTGSPHYIQFIENIDQFDVFSHGKLIRNSDLFKVEGVNVNFVTEIGRLSIYVRTYERGVEDETLSCGTGVTGAAICYAIRNNLFGSQTIRIKTLGGGLIVRFDRISDTEFVEVRLEGSAIGVYKGEINV